MNNFTFTIIILLTWMTLVLPQDFYESCWRGEIEKVEKFIQGNPKIVNSTNEYGYSALMMTTVWGRKNQSNNLEALS